MKKTTDSTTLTTCSFRIGGMTCTACQHRIEVKLKNTGGIHSVSVHYDTGTAEVTYDAAMINLNEMGAVVKSLGYEFEETEMRKKFPVQTALRIAGLLVIIPVLAMLLRNFGTSRFAAAFPLAQSGMGYGILFIIGLLTSAHCIVMCGGINLSQTLRKQGDATGMSLLIPDILYNAGRVISYTAVGIIAGAVGSAFTIPGRLQGLMLLAAGFFMVIMGINMLGVFPALKRITPHLPQFLTEKVNEHSAQKRPLLVGILNGFMPCGPLQAMQLYALSTGSPLRGGLSMFLFCMGTIPLMFTLGAAGSMLSAASGHTLSRRIMQAGAVIIAAMGLTMAINGWNSTGLRSPVDRIGAFITSAFSKPSGKTFKPVIQNGVQIVNSTLLPDRYPVITVQQGIPVRWTINVPPEYITGCNSRFFIREYGIEYRFSPGKNVIEFLPARAGKFRYSCWMSMIHSTIIVLAPGESTSGAPTETEIADKIAAAQTAGSCYVN